MMYLMWLILLVLNPNGPVAMHLPAPWERLAHCTEDHMLDSMAQGPSVRSMYLCSLQALFMLTLQVFDSAQTILW